MAEEPTARQATAEVIALAPAPPVSFTAFYREERPRLVVLATALAGSDRAEEVAQEALLRAHRNWARVSRYDRPGAWVRRVAINLAASSQRRRSAERRALTKVAGQRHPSAPPPEIDGFWSLVRSLPPQQAAAVTLYYLEDRSIADIAVALDCTESTAKAHLHKARTSLAARLAQEDHS